MNIVIITGKELRHSFFRMVLANSICVSKSFCEDKSLIEKVSKYSTDSRLRTKHLIKRDISEKDFFLPFVSTVEDKSNPKIISPGSITIGELEFYKPDLIVTYGCSIIGEEIVNYYGGKILNIHMGLSPYYKGSGTNFWPFVNKELEYVGVTFLLMDSGVDTGPILHQIRARIYSGDSFHQIGNRLISDMSFMCVKIINNFNRLKSYNQLEIGKVYKRKDFSEDSVRDLEKNIREGVVEEYINSKVEYELSAPIWRFNESCLCNSS